MKERDQVIKENSLRVAAQKIPLTIHIPLKRYRVLQEMVRSSGKGSSIFFEDMAWWQGYSCPEGCINAELRNYCQDREFPYPDCHAALIQFLFDEK